MTRIAKLIFVVALAPIGCAEPKPSIMEIAAKEGAVLRTQPSIDAESLGTLKFGETVTVNETRGASQLILGVQGNWKRVKANNLIGWIFGPLLRTPGSDKKLVVVRGHLQTEEEAINALRISQFLTRTTAITLTFNWNCPEPHTHTMLLFPPSNGHGQVKLHSPTHADGKPISISCGGPMGLHLKNWRISEKNSFITVTAEEWVATHCHQPGCWENPPDPILNRTLKLQLHIEEKLTSIDGLQHFRATGKIMNQ